MKHGIMSSFIVAGFLTLTSLATVASADLPPPDGTKFVNFAFTLDGTNAAKDYVFLAYQCDAKDAAALFALESGKPLKIGRHGGGCKLFSMKKDDYEAWQKSVHLTGDWSDPALEAFTKNPLVHRCTGGPNPVFTLPTKDARSEVTESLEPRTVDDKGCVLVSSTQPATTPVPKDAKGATGGDPPPATSTSPLGPAPQPTSHGCGGCALAPESSNDTDVALSLAVALGVVTLTRRRGQAR